MSDLIDRQAVLKHIEKIRQSALMMDDIRRASIIMNGMYLGEKAVRNQPSAQPEIIRCKDCKHFAGEGMYCSCDIIVQFDHFYCYHAERRQDE